MRLPPNYPLFDVQCEGCTFRCQVKAAAGRPQNQIFGAGGNVFYASLKGGHLVPPLIYVANLGNEAAEHFRQILGRIERRMAPHMIETAGRGGREKRSALGRSLSRPGGRRGQTFGRWAVSLAGAAGTAEVTPSERQNGLVARHVVCSATRESEDPGPIANPG
jgi:hypothetical protein